MLETLLGQIYYNLDFESTKSMLKYLEDPALGGGPLIQDLSTSREERIKTPIAALLTDTATFGFYHINSLSQDLDNGSLILNVFPVK